MLLLGAMGRLKGRGQEGCSALRVLKVAAGKKNGDALTTKVPG